MPLDEELKAFALSDVGRRRSHNEDRFLVDQDLGLFMVADGMGGHAAGEIASEIAVHTVHEVIAARNETVRERAERGPRSDVSHRQILGLLEYAVQAASSRINTEAKRDKRKRGMGTTISLLLVAGSYGYVAHVGDSRIYLLRNGVVQQITEDHTVANELLRLGMVTPEQLPNVPRRNAITRAVGVYEHAEVDTLTLELLPNDQFLLSSDGFSSYVGDPAQDIAGPLGLEDGEKVVRALVDFANDKGGKDNITALLVRVGTGDLADTARARRVKLKREVLAQLALFARLNERELLRVMQVAEVHQYKKGEVVMREGEPGDHMFVTLQGRLEVSRGQTVLDEIGPGEQLGEMALIRSTPRSATITALEPCELISLNRRDFFEIIRGEPDLAVKLLWQFLGVLATRLEETTRNFSTVREEPPADEEDGLSTQPPLDSEDRPTPIPDDPFNQPSFRLGRLPLRLGASVLEATLSFDDDAVIEQRIEDSPSFDDAPEIAHRRVDPPVWEGAPVEDSPSFDSWDQVGGESDPETRRRIEQLARELASEGVVDVKRTRPDRRPVDIDPVPVISADAVTPPAEPKRGARITQPMSTLKDPKQRERQQSTEEIVVDSTPKPSRPRHRTLQSAGSSPPPPSLPSEPSPPSSARPPIAPPIAGARRPKPTMPDGRLRAAREEALVKQQTVPVTKGATESERQFRPTKVTIPLTPDESLKQELEALRAEFKQRLEKSRRDRGQKDSD